MERTARKDPTKVDITKPLKAELDDDGSCYGKLWDMRQMDCIRCADNITCGVYYQQTIKKRIRQAERAANGFLDMQDFKKIPVETLAKSLRQTGKIELKKALQVVAHYSGSKDDAACLRWFIDFSKEQGFELKNGFVNAN